MANLFSVVIELDLPTLQNRRRLKDSSLRVASDDVDVEPEVEVGDGALDEVVQVVGVERGAVGLRQVAVQNFSGARGLSGIQINL